MSVSEKNSSPRQQKTICIFFDQNDYTVLVEDSFQYRMYLDEMIIRFPELFPAEIVNGYQMKDSYTSIKTDITIRRIRINGSSYTIRPSFVMPYMTGMTDDIQLPMFYRKFSVPFWAIAYGFGNNAMYWFRIEQSLGRNSIVGTTVNTPESLPKHLIFDEKHTSIQGEKAYIATTVAEGCILGVSIAESAGEKELIEAYGVFKEEAQLVDPEYTPVTGNTDGWKATQNALKFLFPSIHLILCLLHIYISIRDRAKSKFKALFQEIASMLWNCYRAESKASFSQRVRRLYDWAKKASLPETMMQKLQKLRDNVRSYSIAYNFPGCYRISTMLDYLMQRLDRHLFNAKYFHGSISAAELGVRGWALINNFAPSNPTTIKKHGGLISPAERLNGFAYHHNWLHNLLISASLGGYRSPPQNPL